MYANSGIAISRLNSEKTLKRFKGSNIRKLIIEEQPISYFFLTISYTESVFQRLPNQLKKRHIVYISLVLIKIMQPSI